MTRGGCTRRRSHAPIKPPRHLSRRRTAAAKAHPSRRSPRPGDRDTEEESLPVGAPRAGRVPKSAVAPAGVDFDASFSDSDLHELEPQ